MNDIKKLYDLWLTSAVADKDLIPELESVKDDEFLIVSIRILSLVLLVFVALLARELTE